MLYTVRLQDRSCEHLMLSWFDILARIVLAGSKYYLLFFIFHHLYGEKIHGKGPRSYLQEKIEKSELDKSVSEDKDPKKLNL